MPSGSSDLDDTTAAPPLVTAEFLIQTTFYLMYNYNKMVPLRRFSLDAFKHVSEFGMR